MFTVEGYEEPNVQEETIKTVAMDLYCPTKYNIKTVAMNLYCPTKYDLIHIHL